MITVVHTSIKGPASDYIVFPASLPSMFEYEDQLNENIENSVKEVAGLVDAPDAPFKVPSFKWYVPINNTLKYPGKKYFYYHRDRLKVLEDRCTNCNLCVESCQFECWAKGENFPIYDNRNCEFCLGCVHNCPQNAIIFSKQMTDKDRFNKKFYSKYFKQISE